MAKRKAVKKKKAVRKRDLNGLPKLRDDEIPPMPPVKPAIDVPQKAEIKPEPEAKQAPEVKIACKCCSELVIQSMLYICPNCSFEGCQYCRKSGNCPTCGYKLRSL